MPKSDYSYESDFEEDEPTISLTCLQRYKDLTPLISLDSYSFDLFQLFPSPNSNNKDVYFNTTNNSQQSTQTNPILCTNSANCTDDYPSAAHSTPLPQFLQYATQLLHILLTENEDYSTNSFTDSNLLTHSLTLSTPTELLENRTLTLTHILPSLRLLLIVFTPTATTFVVPSLLSLYRFNSYSSPELNLYCYGTLSTVYTHSEFPFLIAATLEGTLLYWDLANPSTFPVHTTDMTGIHSHPIVSILPLTHTTCSLLQFATFDSCGLLCFWILSNQLQLTTTLDISTLLPHINSAFLVDFCIIVATATDCYCIDRLDASILISFTCAVPCVTITCVAHSHHFTHLFIVSYSDGSLALYSIHSTDALEIWSGKGNIVNVEWSCTRSSVFYVVRENGWEVWDLVENAVGPVGKQVGKCTWMSVGEVEVVIGWEERVVVGRLQSSLVEVGVDEREVMEEMFSCE